MAYDDTNRGVLFKNDKKMTEKHPDYTGSLNVNGTDFWLSAWLKTSESGRKYMSVSVQPKDAKKAPQKASKPAPAQTPFDDDNIDDVPW